MEILQVWVAQSAFPHSCSGQSWSEEPSLEQTLMDSHHAARARAKAGGKNHGSVLGWEQGWINTRTVSKARL